MHEFMEMVLGAFDWLTVWGFVSGFIESFLYGALGGLVVTPIYNFLFYLWGKKAGVALGFLFE